MAIGWLSWGGDHGVAENLISLAKPAQLHRYLELVVCFDSLGVISMTTTLVVFLTDADLGKLAVNGYVNFSWVTNDKN